MTSLSSVAELVTCYSASNDVLRPHDAAQKHIFTICDPQFLPGFPGNHNHRTWHPLKHNGQLGGEVIKTDTWQMGKTKHVCKYGCVFVQRSFSVNGKILCDSRSYFKVCKSVLFLNSFLVYYQIYIPPPPHAHIDSSTSSTKNGHAVQPVSRFQSLMAEWPTVLIRTSLIPASSDLCAFDSQATSAVTSQWGRAKNRIEQSLT